MTKLFQCDIMQQQEITNIAAAWWPLLTLVGDMSSASSVISDNDLKAAAEALCKIRGLESTPENLANAASQIQMWQEIQAAIDSTTPVNVG